MELAFREPRVLLGTWRERTDPDGYYAGITYVGTALFILTEDSQSIRAGGLAATRTWQ
jgi:hypothetical protein